jgi:diaminopropionate ammonia-lyase
LRAFFADRRDLVPTPTVALPGLAATLGIGGLAAKDESARFGLNAFKLLGAGFAIETLVRGDHLKAGDMVVCASEGNHGRAVARAAKGAGCAARVYMARDAAQPRADAIAAEGAEVIRVDGSYDDAVRAMRVEAAANGWTIISDTSWDGYERIPFLIMLGYTRMLEEIGSGVQGFRGSGVGSQFPTHIFVQGGVGGLLCAIATWCAFHRPECRVVGVEPEDAACLQASARAGRAVAVEGPLTTTMAGLRNREVSPLAFESLLPNVDAFMAIGDAWAHAAMRALATPVNGDRTIAAGASGAAALGGLIALCRDETMRRTRQQLALDGSSRVLVIVSEGVTDPDLWRAVVSAQ